MIKDIVVTNYLGESVTITLTEEDPEHGFLIEEITGLGPPKGKISDTDLAISDGSIFNFAKLDKRNVVISLIFTMAPTIEDTRQRTYKYFPMKKYITLLIEEDNRSLFCNGYVDKNEPDIFSDQEGCQISIICPDPWLYSIYEDEVVFNGIESLFEFPFSNELYYGTDIIKDTDKDNILDTYFEPIYDNNILPFRTLEFGNIVKDQQKNVPYYGDANVGVIISMHMVGPVKDITIYNTGTRERMHINTDIIQTLTGHGLDTGDDLIISTVKKKKTIKLIRNSEEYNVLNALDRGSIWFELSKGDNWFAYVAKSGGENIKFNIKNQVLYEGM